MHFPFVLSLTIDVIGDRLLRESEYVSRSPRLYGPELELFGAAVQQ